MMNWKRETGVRVFSLFAIFLMVFSLTTPAFAAGHSTNGTSKSLNNLNIKAADKLSERLLSNFKKEEKVTFLVKFTDTTDVTSAAKKAKEKASLANLSDYETKLALRSTIISELKSTAIASHQNVINLLEAEQKKGNVEDFHSYYIVNGMAVTATKEVAEKIARLAEVEKVLPNETRELQTTFQTNEETPKSNVDNVEWNIEQVRAHEAWEIGIDGTGAVVASIDTGVQWSHPALKENYRGYNSLTGEVDHQYSFYDATFLGRTGSYDDHGHGTHVTGTMVGNEPDGTNKIGVAPGAEWIAVKVFDRFGDTSDAILLDAAEWILAPGDRVDLAPDVVNNSWGGGPGMDEWYRDIVITWREYGIFPEFSAGNTTLFNPGGPGSVAVPANYPESFATGAVDINNQVAEFSLRGPSPYDEIKPEVAAPGVNIRSSVPGSGYEGGWNGTSMSAPAVSGVVALLRQANANITVELIEETLLETATPLTDEEYPESPNHGYGWGLVDAYEAVYSTIDGIGGLKGQVTQDGTDNEPPFYEHDPVTETQVGRDLLLSIDVTDNVSISSVQLNYQLNDEGWKTLDAYQTEGDYQEGTFEVNISGDHLQDDGTLLYKWVINDYGNNEVVTDEYEVTVKSGVSVGYFEDFEEEPIGWSSFGEKNSWQWGVPQVGPRGAYSGEKVYATNLRGNYDDNADAILLMPKVYVPEEGAILEFMHWHKLEEFHGTIGRDFGYVVISTDKENWTRLLTVQGESRNWRSEEVDLSNYNGQEVYIGFNLVTDYMTTLEGWYIDDVAITEASLTSQKDTTQTESSDVVPVEYELNALPLVAQVSILESEHAINTSPADGTYSLLHPTGTFTVEAEAYGYHSEQQTVTIEGNETSVADFHLRKKEVGTLTGTLTDEVTRDKISNATIMVMEDANIAPVKTDDEGQFSLSAYEGTYTLRVIARDYYERDFEVTIEPGTVDVQFELEPYYTYPGEIGYDDGTAESARVFLGPGNGWGVKMSLPNHQEKALVTDGAFFLGDIENGSKFAVEVWDASGEDGFPGEKIAGPVEANAEVAGDWTVVDLTDEQIFVEDDFYIVYVQPEQGNISPFLGVDLNSPNAKRSYQRLLGDWIPTPEIEGNYMIRARVSYEIDEPIITDPVDGVITNEPTLTVQGSASPTTNIQIVNNGIEAGVGTVDIQGDYEVAIDLTEGKNELEAVTIINDTPTLSSETVTMTLDTIAPDVTIDYPQNGDEINRETVIVEGTVYDDYLDFVEVDGLKADLDANTFTKRVIVEEGETEITVTAYDKAGNISEETVTVNVEYEFDMPIEKPEITHVTPDTDVTVYPGDELPITFESNVEGGSATFQIQLPSGLTSEITGGRDMTEVKPGQYAGTWVVPGNIDLENVIIQVMITDDEGLTAAKEAAGKVKIISEHIDRIKGDSRFDTAVEISKSGWEQANTVILTRNDDYADALAGVPLAHKLDAPILLTRSSYLSPETLEEIKRLEAENVIVLGGTEAVSEEVIAELEAAGLDVERIRGQSRTDTAVEIAKRVSPEGTDKALVVNGWDFPDALSIASQAAINGLPILLTHTDKLSDPTAEGLVDLGVTETVVFGGTIAISDDVLAELPSAERVNGSNRIETNIAVQEYFNVDTQHMYVATGNEFADSLTGAVLAAKNGSSILLVRNSLTDVTKDYITESNIERLTLFGGTIAISEDIETELEKLLK